LIALHLFIILVIGEVPKQAPLQVEVVIIFGLTILNKFDGGYNT
jgi:hypothetical protein